MMMAHHAIIVPAHVAAPVAFARPSLAVVRRGGVPVAQVPQDNEDDAYLEEIEAALNAPPGSTRRADPGLRIQRAISRARPPQRRTSPPRYTRESTQLFRLPSTLRGAYDDFLERPGQPLILGSLALLVGFYLAGALSTIFGAAGFWEPTIALGPLTVTELITRRYYSRPLEERSQTIRLLNALKVGFYLGIVIDALKLAG
jgi:hypothetical protein